jgi:xylan 1,4-beta-xylosidase
MLDKMNAVPHCPMFTKMRSSLRRTSLSLVALFLAVAVIPSYRSLNAQQAPATETDTVDVSAKGTPFPHFWEQMFGSGRAVLSMRESYRDDLRAVKAVTGFQYVRFHGIFLDEVGVYDEDASGNPIYNFSYVDQIYDGLLKNGVRPFVELSFMPKKLAAEDVHQAFWYRPVVAPPKDYAKWDDLIRKFAEHLVARYGIDEVASWYFEVWNEPNLDFWAGKPSEPTYYQLYDETAKTLKSVSPRLRVGGPATAQAAWVDRFIAHTASQNVPVDFVSTHVYGNDNSKDVFGTTENIPRTQMVCRAVKKVHDQIQASAKPTLPLIWSEFNASYMNETDITDSIYMGPWMAGTIRDCNGLVDIMSYWTFSDVFEEQGVVKKPFYGGYGLVAAYDLPKPAFNAFKMFHMLGDTKLSATGDDILATKRADGTLAIALWNLATVRSETKPKDVTLQLNSSRAKHATIYRLDADHGSLLKTYAAMGSPIYPTRDQLDKLKEAAKLPAPESATVKNGRLQLHLEPEALLLIELR